MSVLYLDCFSGIAGDMAVGALLDLGAPLADVQAGVAALGVEGLETGAERVSRSHVAGTQYLVHVPHEHAHRSFADIKSMIESAGLRPRAREVALEVFWKLAQAEGAIHDKPAEDVTFHEVGAADSIADIVGFAVALDLLDVDADAVRASSIPWSEGTVQAAHGALPVPAPATAALLQGFTLVATDVPGELVTPTGAAILAATAGSSTGIGELRLQKVGYGAGSRDLPGRPNLLRAVLGTEPAAAGKPLTASEVVVLETNLDDMDPRMVPPLFDALFAGGALDVWVTPIQMKKGRPALQLSVLTRESVASELLPIVLRHSTTLGVRYRRMERVELDRELVSFDCSLGTVQIKVAGGRGRPELDDCRRLADEHGLSVVEVMETVITEWRSRGDR